MIIGQVNRQVAYGGLSDLFKKRKDTEIFSAAREVIAAKNVASYLEKNGGTDSKKIAEAAKEVEKTKKTLRKVAGKDSNIVKKILA